MDKGVKHCAGLIDHGLANCHGEWIEAKWKSNPALRENVSWHGEKNTRNCWKGWKRRGELWRAISRGKRTNQSINLLYARRHQLARIYVNESNSYSRRWLRLENGGRKNVNLTLNNIFRLLFCLPPVRVFENDGHGRVRNWVYCSTIFYCWYNFKNTIYFI